MANDDTCEFKEGHTKCITKDTPKRNNYFSGKLMTHKHLIDEQQYYINKLKQMNREFTGYGIVNGLVATYNNNIITVRPGIGIDSCGNVLAIYNKKREFKVEELKDNDFIYLKFKEKSTGKPVARYTKEDNCSSTCCDDYIEEDMEIFTNPKHFPVGVNDICLNKKAYLSVLINILKECDKTDNEIRKLLENERLGKILEECGQQTEEIDAILKLLENVPEFEATPHYGKQENGSFLLLGKYVNGKIDNSFRTELHTNAELSKALCEIQASYVKSLNGKTGEIKIEAGNNIDIETKENTITIASTASDSYHKEYYITFEGNSNPQIIKHKLGVFPSVDIYLSDDNNAPTTAILKETLKSNAEDLTMDFEKYRTNLNALTIKESIITKKILVENNLVLASSVAQLWTNEKVWKDEKTMVPPRSLLVISHEPLEAYLNEIYIIKKPFNYRKIAMLKGNDDAEMIKVDVLHKDHMSLQINVSTTTNWKVFHLLVILNG